MFAGSLLMSDKPLILLIASNRANLTLLSQQLGQQGFETMSAASLEEVDKALEEPRFALSLIDLSGFDQNLWARCEELRKARIPFIVISPQRSPAVQRDSMKHGASGLLVKPVGVKALIEYIRTLVGD